MSRDHIAKISAELNQPSRGVKAVIELIDGGSTVPFIARYRKEATGSLDEVAVTSIRDRIRQLRELDKRRQAVLTSLQEQGKLTDELKAKVMAAETLTVLEDIYLPYRPKRRTRATIAKEKGLEPLAEALMAQTDRDIHEEARKFIDPEKKVDSVEAALAGARDIIAEWVNENAPARAQMRELYFEEGVFHAKVIRGREADGANYKDYFDWKESVKTVPSHRFLAVRRAEKEKVLSFKVEVDNEKARAILEKNFIKADNPAAGQVRLAMADGFKRLLSLSMETEVRTATKDLADKEAIHVFSENLRQLLMAPPLGQRYVMAIDPGFRTGCKIVCLDPGGHLMETETIYPSGDEKRKEDSRRILKDLAGRCKVEFIAVGNGTACRETESFVRACGLSPDIHVLIASETGASVYSASEAAREEFPDP